MDFLECRACGGASVTYPQMLKDDQPVMCARCGAVVSTLGELKQRVDKRSDGKLRKGLISGC